MLNQNKPLDTWEAPMFFCRLIPHFVDEIPCSPWVTCAWVSVDRTSAGVLLCCLGQGWSLHGCLKAVLGLFHIVDDYYSITAFRTLYWAEAQYDYTACQHLNANQYWGWSNLDTINPLGFCETGVRTVMSPLSLLSSHLCFLIHSWYYEIYCPITWIKAGNIFSEYECICL